MTDALYLWRREGREALWSQAWLLHAEGTSFLSGSPNPGIESQSHNIAHLLPVENPDWDLVLIHDLVSLSLLSSFEPSFILPFSLSAPWGT